MKSTAQSTPPKKSAKVRGKNYGHHSGLHGEARNIRTRENKTRRAAARARKAAKRAAR